MSLSIEGESMRKNLGRALACLLFVWHVPIWASGYEWEVSGHKTRAATNEAIYLHYLCTFEDRGELYTIDFNPTGENETYKLELLSQRDTIVDGRRRVSYEFVVFAKKSGRVVLAFDYTMKKTNERSIENVTIGRDNTQKEEFTLHAKRHKSLEVEVYEVITPLVGEIELQIKSQTPKVQAYEPFHLETTFEGVGSLHLVEPPLWRTSNVKVFTQKPKSDLVLSKEGYKGEQTYSFAFVGDQNFTIPKQEWHVYDPKTQKYRTLVFEAIEVEVVPGYTKEALLDAPLEEEAPIVVQKEYAYYLLFFLLGYASAKLVQKKYVPKKAQNSELAQKIEEAKDFDRLLTVLVLSEKEQFKIWINKIEKKEVLSLKSVKKELSKLI